jgi:hypothetical protein
MSENQNPAFEMTPHLNVLNGDHPALKLWRENGFPLFPGAGKRPYRSYPQVTSMTSSNYATDSRA